MWMVTLKRVGSVPYLHWRAAASSEGIVWKPTLTAPGVYRLPS